MALTVGTPRRTEAWIRRALAAPLHIPGQRFQYRALFMRKGSDSRDDSIIKREIYELRQVKAKQINCPNCAGPLDLKAPDKTERVVATILVEQRVDTALKVADRVAFMVGGRIAEVADAARLGPGAPQFLKYVGV